jgi:hypothetical protein
MSNSSRHEREYRVATMTIRGDSRRDHVTTLGSRVFTVGLEPAVAGT